MKKEDLEKITRTIYIDGKIDRQMQRMTNLMTLYECLAEHGLVERKIIITKIFLHAMSLQDLGGFPIFFIYPR